MKYTDSESGGGAVALVQVQGRNKTETKIHVATTNVARAWRPTHNVEQCSLLRELGSSRISVRRSDKDHPGHIQRCWRP